MDIFEDASRHGCISDAEKKTYIISEDAHHLCIELSHTFSKDTICCLLSVTR